MAAFSTLALIGLAAGVGSLAGRAGKKTTTQQPQTLAAPAPTNADTIAAPATPPSLLEQQSRAIAAGRLVGDKKRRQIGAGGRRPMTPSSIGAPRPIVRPTTLIGGAY